MPKITANPPNPKKQHFYHLQHHTIMEYKKEPCQDTQTINTTLPQIQVQIIHSTPKMTRIRVKGKSGMSCLVDVPTPNLKKWLRQFDADGTPIFPETMGIHSNDIIHDADDSSLVCVLVAHGYIRAGIASEGFLSQKEWDMKSAIHDIQKVHGYEI